jgi:hypothetical protein
MDTRSKNSLTAMVACIGVLLATTAMAQSPPSPTTQGGMSMHHQMMYKMMGDMSQQMTGMANQMSKGELTPDQHKQMAQMMEKMSGMMHRMSGAEAMPAMNDPEQKKQMDEMRKQMDEMMSTSPMTPGTK